MAPEESEIAEKGEKRVFSGGLKWRPVFEQNQLTLW